MRHLALNMQNALHNQVFQSIAVIYFNNELPSDYLLPYNNEIQTQSFHRLIKLNDLITC